MHRWTPIYKNQHQKIDFLSLANLIFWDALGLVLKEKMYVGVHVCDVHVSTKI